MAAFLPRFEQANTIMQQEDDALTVRSTHGRLVWPVILAMIGLVDVTLFRTAGFAGPALFFLMALGLLLLARGRISWNPGLVIVAALLAVLSASMVWAGSAWQIIAATWLLIAGNLAAQNVVPYVLETIIALAAIVPGGYEFLHGVQLGWRRVVLDPVDHGQPSKTLNYALPIISVIVFGTVFMLANPDIIKEISALFSEFFELIHGWVSHFSAFEIVVWCLTFWFTGGLLCPAVRDLVKSGESVSDEVPAAFDHPLYKPFRNTLMTLISLFALYLSFEFCTLWFRKFPEGFHYSGYAHEGAAWLTVALALATLTLSLIFRGSMLNDPRIVSLKKLAWIWSVLNFLLAASVYNRLLIYVDFNGMTRMRVIGFLGTTAVVGGFVLVLFKIRQRQEFIWLIRRQLWVLAFAIYLYLAMPVDLLVHRFNVRQILAGSAAPSVQISEHPINDDALPQLLPLLNCDDEVIRNGIQAQLRVHLRRLRSTTDKDSGHWTATQFGKRHARQQLENAESKLNMLATQKETDSAIERFREYAMQWW